MPGTVPSWREVTSRPPNRPPPCGRISKKTPPPPPPRRPAAWSRWSAPAFPDSLRGAWGSDLSPDAHERQKIREAKLASFHPRHQVFARLLVLLARESGGLGGCIGLLARGSKRCPRTQ